MRPSYDQFGRGHAGRDGSVTLTAGELRQIQEAFQQLQHKAQQWEANARKWESEAKTAQSEGAECEARAATCRELAEQAQRQAAAWEAKARQLEASIDETAENESETARLAEDLEVQVQAAQARAAALEEVAAAAQSRVAELEEEMAGQQAEYQNSRKRLERLFASQAEQERRALVVDMLPVLDNLERALKHMPKGKGDAEALQQGVAMTRRAFLSALEKNGVQPIDPAGQPFDPKMHEAIGMMPASGLPPGTVAHVEQKGYRHGEDILRPARVLVTPG